MGSEEICQEACQHVPTCKYYIWDSSTANETAGKGGDCELLDSGSRICDMVIVNVGVTATITETPFRCTDGAAPTGKPTEPNVTTPKVTTPKVTTPKVTTPTPKVTTPTPKVTTPKVTTP